MAWPRWMAVRKQDDALCAMSLVIRVVLIDSSIQEVTGPSDEGNGGYSVWSCMGVLPNA